MCGLVGIAGKFLSKEDTEVLKLLLHFDVLRGHHSTGIGMVYDLFHEKKEPTEFVLKETGTPEHLYEAYPKLFHQGMLPSWGLNVAMGHNRWATQGAVNVDNAHPFEFDNVIGAHNGTVQKFSLRGFHEADKFEVDSQMIFSHINHKGDVKEVWEKAEGAMALVWWDKKEKKLNFIRNKERPLFVAVGEFDGKLYWASEDWMIKIACGRCGVKIKDLRMLDENIQYTFTLGAKLEVVETVHRPFQRPAVVVPVRNNVTYSKNDKKNRHKLSSFEEEVSFKITGWFPSVASKDNGWAIGKTTKDKKIKIFCRLGQFQETKARCEARGPDVIYHTEAAYKTPKDKDTDYTVLMEYVFLDEDKDEAETVFGFNKCILTKEQFEDAVNCGCVNCTGPVLWADRQKTFWEGQNEPVCRTCIDYGYYNGTAFNAYGRVN